eukprot:Nitzschia sp. Nitz4//scaffold87_size112219//87289//89139//NITZ4_004085-RA/size112219-processed-gene-0.112-mRNA-1//1//CDS//3329559402//6463//frame0
MKKTRRKWTLVLIVGASSLVLLRQLHMISLLVDIVTTEHGVVVDAPLGSFRLRHEAHGQSSTSAFTSDICQRIASSSSSPFQVWLQNLPHILKASQPPTDPHWIHKDWMSRLLELLTTRRHLDRSLQREAPLEARKAILHVLQHRIQHPHQAPPLKVVVMGGSTTEGQACHLVSKQLHVVNATKGTTGQLYTCAWPSRLERLWNINGAKGATSRNLVQVINLSVGGTHSGLAGPFLKYWLNPEAFAPHGPDIIINAYSTNDAVPHAFHYGAAPYNTTVDFYHMRHVVQKRLDFLQHARQSYCGPHQGILPLVVFVDDYIGDQQESVLGDMQMADITLQPPRPSPNQPWDRSLDSTMLISYSEVVRRLVYAFSRETIFTPSWNMKDWTRAKIHFGMAAHVAISWVVAYASMQTVVHTCQDSVLLSKEPNLPKTTNYADLVTPQCDFMGGKSHPCTFAFLAAPLGTHNNAYDLNAFLDTYTIRKMGWQAMDQLGDGGYQNKLGVIAEHVNATLSLEFVNLRQPIRVITIHALKSYSEKFQDSLVRFRLERKSGNSSSFSPVTTVDVSGYHSQLTSIAEPFVLELSTNEWIASGDSARLHLELIRGDAFQLNALMLCSR